MKPPHHECLADLPIVERARGGGSARCGVMLLVALLGGSGLASAEEPAKATLCPLAELGDATFRHFGDALDTAYSPDGQFLLSTDFEELKVWNAETGRLVRRLGGFDPGYGWTIALSADGKLCAAGSTEGGVRVLEHATGRVVSEFRVGKDSVWKLAFFSKDSRLLVVTRKALVTCDPQDGQKLLEVDGTFEVRSLVVEPEGAFAWIGEATPEAHVPGVLSLKRRSLGDLKVDREIQVDSSDVGSVSPDGRLWAAATLSSDLKTIVVGGICADGNRRWELPAHDDSVVEIAFVPDGQGILLGMMNGGVELWNVKTRSRTWLHGFHDHGSGLRDITAIRPSPDGKRIAVAARDALLSVHELDTGKVLLPSLKGHMSRVDDMAFRPGCAQLVSRGADNSVIVWDLTTRTEACKRTMHGVTPVISPDGRIVLFTHTSGAWSLPDLEPLWKNVGYLGDVRFIAFSSDSKSVVLDIGGGGVSCRSAATGEEYARLENVGGSIDALQFTADAKRILFVNVWNPRDSLPKICEWEPDKTEHRILCVGSKRESFELLDDTRAIHLKPDGHHLIEIGTGNRIRTLFGRDFSMRTPGALAPPLACALEDGLRALQLVDIDTGQILLRQELPLKSLRAVLCPKGDHLATIGSDQVIRVFAIER